MASTNQGTSSSRKHSCPFFSPIAAVPRKVQVRTGMPWWYWGGLMACSGWERRPRAVCRPGVPGSLKLHASTHQPLCELSSTGFRQPHNVLQGSSWRAAKAVIRGNIISPVPGLEKARYVSQKEPWPLSKNIKTGSRQKFENN